MTEIDGASVPNQYNIRSGENLANTTFALRGQKAFVRQSTPGVPTFRTKQEAFYYAAHLLRQADNLPDHPNDNREFDEIRNTLM